jgi:hypothetical protein
MFFWGKKDILLISLECWQVSEEKWLKIRFFSNDDSEDIYTSSNHDS